MVCKWHSHRSGPTAKSQMGLALLPFDPVLTCSSSVGQHSAS